MPARVGIHRVRLLVLTHSHLDHVGGIVGAVHGRRVDAAITSPLDEPVSGYRLARDALAGRGVPLRTAVAGMRLVAGSGSTEVSLRVLGPRQVLTGTRSDPNNDSLVLSATVGGRRILLAGDAEIEGQDELLDDRDALRADVLKVPHHGSAYSDPEFLRSVRESVAVISVGLHNDYDHPAPSLLAELSRESVPTFRTDRSGDLAVVDHGGRLSVLGHHSADAAGSAPENGRRPSERRFLANQPAEPFWPGASSRCPLAVTSGRARHTARGGPRRSPDGLLSVPDGTMAACRAPPLRR